MQNTNIWTGIGNLTADPELKFNSAGTAISTFRIAVNGYKDEVSFLKIVSFGKLAENNAKFLVKGKKVCVTGRIKTGSYETEDGSKRYTFEIIANNVEFLSKVQGGQQLAGETHDDYNMDDMIPF